MWGGWSRARLQRAAPAFPLALGLHHGAFPGKGEARGWGRRVCSNGWRCRARPVAEGLFRSSGGSCGGSQGRQNRSCSPGAAPVASGPRLGCVRPRGPETGQLPRGHAGECPSLPARRRTGEDRQPLALGWSERSCCRSPASLRLLPPSISSTSINPNRLLAARRVRSRGRGCRASGSRAACVL